MKPEQFVTRSYALILTTAELAREIQAWDEAPPDKISKFSFFLVDSAETGPGPTVVRHVITGWGLRQHESLLAGAWEHARSAKGAIVAVVRSYGDHANSAVRIDGFYGKSRFSVEFPYQRIDGGFEYKPPLTEVEQPLLAALADWASQAIRKPFLGLF